MTVGEKIKKIRTFRGMTQKELGSMLRMGSRGADNRIAQYETNYRVPKAELLDGIAGALNVNPQNFYDPVPDSLDAFNLGNDLDSIYGNTGDIANNTAATADALDIAEEDLAYLRDIAEREAINRFTTAEIKVEQHNENHIASELDVDGIMAAWTESFAEQLAVSAEGVHE